MTAQNHLAFTAPFRLQGEPASGEPDWLPSPEAVARARRGLERSGILAALGGRSAAVAPATPWRWMAGASAWLVVWPAVLALRLVGGRWAWLPVWLPVILAALHMAILVLAAIRSERTANRDPRRRAAAAIRTPAQLLALEPREFESWVGLLFELSGFTVRDTPTTADHGIDLTVSGPLVANGLVQCKRYRGTVGEPVVRDLYGTLIHSDADFAWLATTGGVSRQAREWAAGKPLGLWDGQRLLELAGGRR
jgi:hypothetical protein